MRCSALAACGNKLRTQCDSGSMHAAWRRCTSSSAASGAANAGGSVRTSAPATMHHSAKEKASLGHEAARVAQWGGRSRCPLRLYHVRQRTWGCEAGTPVPAYVMRPCPLGRLSARALKSAVDHGSKRRRVGELEHTRERPVAWLRNACVGPFCECARPPLVSARLSLAIVKRAYA